jgi:hypothetical protein
MRGIGGARTSFRGPAARQAMEIIQSWRFLAHIELNFERTLSINRWANTLTYPHLNF